MARTKDTLATPPPHSLDAEQSVLGAALISASAPEKLLGILVASDFYLQAHRSIYEAVGAVAARGLPCDIGTIGQELERRGVLGMVGGLAYLITLTETCPIAAHVEHYAQAVLEYSQRRDAVEYADTLRAAALNGSTPESIIVGAEEWASRMRAGRRQKRSIYHASDLPAMDIPDPVFVIPGILHEGLWMLVGASKQGKSWAAAQIATAIATGGAALGAIPVERGRVLYIALEDTLRRLKSRLRKIIPDGEPWPETLDIAVEWPRADDGGLPDISTYLARNTDCRLVIIDILGRFRSPRRSDVGRLYDDDIADLAPLKSIADRRHIGLMVVHHMNKSKPDDISDTISGTSGIAGTLDGWWLLERKRDARVATLHVTGRDIEESQQLAMEWDPRTAWTLRGEAAQFANTSEQREVLEFLREHSKPIQPRHLQDALGISRDAAKHRLFRMAAAGMVLHDDGWYSLLPSDSERSAVTGVTGDPLSPVTVGDSGDRKTAVTAKRDSGDSGDSGDSRTRISRILVLARRHDWPSLPVGGSVLPAGEENWQHAVETYADAFLARVQAALEALP